MKKLRLIIFLLSVLFVIIIILELGYIAYQLSKPPPPPPKTYQRINPDAILTNRYFENTYKK